MNLPIPLRGKCIETALRREHNARVTRAIKLRFIDKTLEAELTLLRSALESFDFKGLRAGYRELSGNTTCTVELVDTDTARPGLIVNNRQIINSK